MAYMGWGSVVYGASYRQGPELLQNMKEEKKSRKQVIITSNML